MECFMNNNTIQCYEHKTLNKCRIYLQVFTIADIATGDGKIISKNTWEGKKSSPLRPISNCPLWGKPSQAEWKIWRKAIISTFLVVADRNLKQHLGPWHLQPLRKWLTDIRDESLWEATNNQWKCWKKWHRSYIIPRYKEKQYTTTQIPPLEQFKKPTTVYIERNMIFKEGSLPTVPPKPNKKHHSHTNSGYTGM